MLKKLAKLIKRNWVFILIAFIVFFAYGKTLQMYWWVDDWGLLFKMIHPSDSPGNLGAGIVGYGPYRYLATPFILLFPLVKFYTQVYFGIGLVLYYIAAILVFVFVREITKNKIIPILSASIFASGYIGSYALYRLSNSYQLTGTVIFLLLVLIFLAKYYKFHKKNFYFLSLLFYVATLEFFFLRANGIVLVVLALGVVFYIRDRKQKIIRFLFEQLSFVFVYYLYYFKGFAITPGAGGSISSGFLRTMINEIFVKGQYELTVNFVLTFIRMLFPSVLLRDAFLKLDALVVRSSWSTLSYHYSFFFLVLVVVAVLVSVFLFAKNRNKLFLLTASFLILVATLFVFAFIFLTKPGLGVNVYEGYSALFGIFTIWVIALTTIVQFKNGKKDSLLVFFGLAIIVANISTYFVYNPTNTLDSTSRYVVPALVGTGIIIATVLSFIKKKIVILLLGGAFCGVLIYFTNKEESFIVKYISTPDKQGYALINKIIPQVDKNTVVYIETSDDPVYKNNVLGGMPQLGISIFKGFDDNVKIAESYQQLFKMILNKEASIDNIYTFYYGEDGYINTTPDFRKFLVEGSRPMELNNWNVNVPGSVGKDGLLSSETLIDKKEQGTVGVNPVLETSVDYSSITPLILELRMKLTPINFAGIRYPYFDMTSSFPNKVNGSDLDGINIPTVPAYSSAIILSSLQQSLQRYQLIKKGEVTASSYYGAQTPRLVIDERNDTCWSSNNVPWNYRERPQWFIVKLPSPTLIKSIYWINHYYGSTPTDYSIETSNDSKNWVKAVNVKDGKMKNSGEVVKERINPVNASYIRFSVGETYKDNTPAVDEIWVSSDSLQVSPDVQETIVNCPFCFIPNLQTAGQVFNLEKELAKVRISWTSDRSPNYYSSYFETLNVFLDGKFHTYYIYLPAQGTRLLKLKIDSFLVPSRVDLSNASIRAMNIDELGLYNALLP